MLSPQMHGQHWESCTPPDCIRMGGHKMKSLLHHGTTAVKCSPGSITAHFLREVKPWLAGRKGWWWRASRQVHQTFSAEVLSLQHFVVFWLCLFFPFNDYSLFPALNVSPEAVLSCKNLRSRILNWTPHETSMNTHRECISSGCGVTNNLTTFSQALSSQLLLMRTMSKNKRWVENKNQGSRLIPSTDCLVLYSEINSGAKAKSRL